ncbi:DUF2314 domain-containing protein [Mucilaginibacter pedocola]|uniref:DUF2314 domain-containing protein n=1 Tax=Mucilaginibacter pedocola TaxID=1792845 RepID=A0A1S9PAS8_9SPHI|nr:DUF2314 domain-containing protein [Mucilaginibacter pedocola]OOQ58055.1 hypothetical protein BC343_10365 [Mucilaginibacter pedocola]
MMNKQFVVCLLSIVFATTACKHAKKEEAGSIKTVMLDTDDAKFLAFKDTAQAHIGQFIDSLKPHALDSNYRFLVKSDFVEGKKHEHMWSVVYKYNDSTFTGIFADSALDLHNIQPGAPVLIKQGEVEDWAIYDYKRNTDLGNFSDKYLKSKKKSQ